MATLTPHQIAALNYKDHISLTANPGSGKTFVLSKRYLEIAINEDVHLRNIAAITFTDKAASELYKKIVTEVESKLKQETKPDIFKKLERIRRELVSANISTIHSFCLDILKEFPVEADLDANFQPIDVQLSNELIELSVEEVIKSSLDNTNERENIKYLIRVFTSKRIFAEQLFYLVKNRKNVLEIQQSAHGGYNDNIEEIANRFYEFFLRGADEVFIKRKEIVTKILPLINNTVLQESKDNKYANNVRPLLRSLKHEEDTEEALKILHEIKRNIFTIRGSLKIKDYLKRDNLYKLKNEVDIIEEYFADLKNVTIADNHRETELELARFGKIILYFFQKVAELYEKKKRDNGYLDYEDMLLYAKKILSDSEVQQILSEKYKYVMIDEYQDTNELQYRIFLPLLDYLKKGNLFVVGDEKQSIYMFRDAELEVFSTTKNDIAETSGPEYLLTLPDSFRMAPAVCLFTNKLFKSLFNNPLPIFNEVNYSELICARQNEFNGKVEILLGNEEKPGERETDLVAKRILKLLHEENTEQKLKWKDVAVLIRKRKSFADLEAAFLKYRIPFNIVGGTGFYQRQIIYDFYNYFSFLLNKNNDSALIGILRSPFFSISDSEIFEISLEGYDSYWERFKSYSDSHNEFKDVVKQLEEILLLSESYSPAELLRKILSESDYLAVTSSKINGQQELANIEKLLKLTNNFNLRGFRTLYDYVNYLKESIEQSEDEAQASVTDDSNISAGIEGSVKIMTLHQAKGLEFKAVFLYKCDEVALKNYVKSKALTVNKRYGLLTKVPVNENYFATYESAPVILIHNLISEKKEIAEIKRLFYVGITRAIDYLFISATRKEFDKYQSDSFIGLLKEGLKINFDSPSFNISSNLSFLRKKDDNYSNETKQMQIEIPIIKHIDEINLPREELSSQRKKVILKTGEIVDKSEGEFISATKVAVFNQCPLKYQLMYEYGFSGLMEQFHEWNIQRKGQKLYRYEFNPAEIKDEASKDETAHNLSMFADVKGRIIHKVLQNEISKELLNDFISGALKDEFSVMEFDKNSFNQLKENILNDVKNFYGSSSFSYIRSFKNYKNEYKVYLKEKDYFLFGIIDKLILYGNKALIVDYKTDDITLDEIPERFTLYLNQLKFYSYIVSKLFDNVSEFEVRVIFIKHPERVVSEVIKRESLKKVSSEIENTVKSIRERDFAKNLNHCSECIFAVNHEKCIVN
jgi:ATP-dependent helicase/nuclease subunit A